LNTFALFAALFVRPATLSACWSAGPDCLEWHADRLSSYPNAKDVAMKTNAKTHTQRHNETVHYASICCWQKVSEEDLDHASARCPRCGHPAIVQDFHATPEFANAVYAARVVHSPKNVKRVLGPDWRQVAPWQSLGKYPGTLQRLWYEYGADPSSVMLVRYLTSFALFARNAEDGY
jgi:DNA-directed RNA polymerase subunit RPC12/RpoP